MTKLIKHKDIKAEVTNIQCWLTITDPIILKELSENLLEQAEYIVIDYIEYFFPNDAWTAVWLLAESHLAIHTFPQDNVSYFELSGCNASKTSKLETLLKETGLIKI